MRYLLSDMRQSKIKDAFNKLHFEINVVIVMKLKFRLILNLFITLPFNSHPVGNNLTRVIFDNLYRVCTRPHVRTYHTYNVAVYHNAIKPKHNRQSVQCINISC